MKPGEIYYSVFSGYLSKEKVKSYTPTGEFREPKKGEYFLSGAIVEAYEAWSDMKEKYWIAVPVEYEVCPHCKGLGKVIAKEGH